MYCYGPTMPSMRAVDPGYEPQAGEILLDHYPPLPGEVPSYDAAMAALATTASSSALKAQAQAALDKADTTRHRTQDAGITWPAAWGGYCAALRVIISSGSGTIPALPATYPDGTPT